MEFVINKVPFAMEDIPEQLFNVQFLSDVTFIVDNKKIYAHSIELMKRSMIFLKQLKATCGEQKLIPITDYGYDVFYQFIRFIYTDNNCEDFLNEENCDALLNLAKEYKVSGLVNVVQKYKKIEFENGHVPHEMKQISYKWFNLNFLSDVSFIIDGKTIYAHSFELMKRSSVFQQQLEKNMGEKKEIPISDYVYNTFYQFIRFIYTDYCDISDENCFELMNLAIKYKIISLINYIQNSFQCDFLKLANLCDFANDQSTAFGTFSVLSANRNLEKILASNSFITTRHEILEKILINQITSVSEMEIIKALARWMEHHCSQNGIQFNDCLQKFNKLIRLIRFPILSNDELVNIQASYPALLTESDIANIGGYKTYGDDYEVIWSCTPRTNFQDLVKTWYNETKWVLLKSWYYETKWVGVAKSRYNITKSFRTKFLVRSELIMTEFIIGKCGSTNHDLHSDHSFECIKITISSQNSELDEINQTPININIHNFQRNFDSTLYGLVINLGSSICFRPGFTYSIDYEYQATKITRYYPLYGRDSQTEVIIEAPTKSVKILEAHETMFAMYFLKPDGNHF